MRNYKILILSLFIIILFYTNNIEAAGGYAGGFLRLGVGTRALAMGGAGSALLQGSASNYWNPAMLSRFRGRYFGSDSRFMSLDRKQHFISYNGRLGEKGGLGISWLQYDVDNIDGRDYNGNPTEELKDREQAILFSFGLSPHPLLGIGINAKWLQHTLVEQTATGFSFDIAWYTRLTSLWSFGIVLQDIGGSSFKWEVGDLWDKQIMKEDKIPMVLRAAWGWHFADERLLLCGELRKRSDNGDLTKHLGLEMVLDYQLIARCGYDNGTLTFGFGMLRDTPLGILSLDYAYLEDAFDIRPSHNFGLSTHF